MKEERNKRENGQREKGAALLIAIFALMLISVVAIAMIVSQGTDSALAGNYRTSTSAYYAAVAGLEEARGRLLWKNPDCFVNVPNSPPNPNCPNPGFIPMGTGVIPSVLPAMGLTQVRYILNPASGETVDPTSANPANYPDTEYAQEFPDWGLGGATVQTTPSVWSSAPLPGPTYKWVRINPITEAALNLDVDNNGTIDRVATLFYDPANVDSSNKPLPGLLVSTPGTPPIPPTNTAVQALEITALAVMPNGSRRMLQYVVAPLVVSTQIANPLPSTPPFPAALTMDGNNVSYQDPGTPDYVVDGRDLGAGICTPPRTAVESIEYTNPSDSSYWSILANVTPVKSSYPGYLLDPTTYAPTTPSVPLPSVPTAVRQSWLTPATLDAVVQDITKSADVVIAGPATGSNMPTWPPSNPIPMTVVVNGNLNLTRWYQTGYGLLLVTGTLTYDPDVTWNGIVLVIGQGNLLWSDRGHGNGGINGAVLVANTRDASGNLLPALGSASFSGAGGSGRRYSAQGGIVYNSCWVNSAGAQAPLTYKILSFHEIPTN
jgi:hypothetical protein